MNAWWLLLAMGQEDRDGSQTPTLYRAEKVLFEHGDIRWLHDGQIGGFLDSVFDDPWFRRQFPKAIKPRVAVGRFSDRSYAEGNTLYFSGHPKTGRPTACNFSVLHELNIALQADLLLVMAGGRIVHQGRPRDAATQKPPRHSEK